MRATASPRVGRAAPAARSARSRARRSRSARARRAAPTRRRCRPRRRPRRARRRAAATACAQVFSFPRSRAAITTPRSSAASRSPEIEQLARDDRGDHPGREDVLVEQHDQRRHHEQLVGDRVEQRPERRGAAACGARSGRRTSRSPSRRRRRPSPSSRGPWNGTAKSATTIGTDDCARDGQLVGEAHPTGEYGVVFAQSPGREPRRDRDPHLPHAPRARHRLGRRLLRRRPRCAPRRATPTRPSRSAAATAGRELPRRREAARRRARGRAPRPSIPGYGFLAENAAFARAVEAAGLVWIGPPPAAIELMGSKTRARQAMQAAGVPIIPGTTEPGRLGRGGRRARRGDRLPAADQGGGRRRRQGHEGRRARRTRPTQAFESAQREGQSYFADASVYVERYLEDPRHVEVQVLADAHGNVDPPRRARLHDPAPPPEAGRGDAVARRRRPSCASGSAQIAVDAARAAGYRSAGTIEGLLAPGRLLLLHGDEHAHPGRAHGHGARHGPRPRPRAGADRGGRAAIAARRRTSAAAATRSSAGSTPRTRRTASCPTPGTDHELPRAVRPGGARRLGRRARDRRSRRSTTR